MLLTQDNSLVHDMRRTTSSIKLGLLSSFKRRTEDDPDKVAAEAAIQAVHDAQGTGRSFETIVENALQNETDLAGKASHTAPARGPSLQNMFAKAPSFRRTASLVKNPSFQRNVSKYDCMMPET